MKRIIVTGGAGFIGSTLVNRLIENHESKFDQLIIVDKLTYAANLKNIESALQNSKVVLEVVDITDNQAMSRILKDGDYIFHLAAESHVDNSIVSGADFWKTNVLGTSNLLEIIKYFNKTRMIYVSTDEVYGSIESGSFSENSEINPSSPYSASKASGELACFSYKKTHATDIVVTRSCNNFGSGQNGEKLLPVLVSKVLNQQPVPIYGTGTNVREWIPDWVNAEYLIQIMFEKKEKTVFNIGSGFHLTNLEMCSLVGETLGLTPMINFVEDRAAHDFRYSVSSERLFQSFRRIEYDCLNELRKTILEIST